MKNKKFYKVCIVVGIFILVIVALFACGFRITYAPDLENDWDAISGTASWIAVILSFVSIVYAIRVPKNIATAQNKISLFEKRYEAFQYYERCYALSKSISQQNDKRSYVIAYLVSIERRNPKESDFDKLIYNIPLNELFNYEFYLHQLYFLFPIEDNDVKALHDALCDFAFALNMTEVEIEKAKNVYINIVEQFDIKYRRVITSLIEIQN